MTRSTPTPPPSEPRLTLRAWRRPAAWVLALVMLWTVLLGWALPRWARHEVEVQAGQALGTSVTLRGLSFNPWTLTLTLNDLVVGPTASPWLQLQALQAQASLQSVWRAAPVLRQVRLIRPTVNLERLDAHTFNISPALARLQSGPPTPNASPARFALYNIEVVGGDLRYTDRVLGSSHHVADLQVGIPFVSNLPSQVQVTVRPLLRATVDGGSLDIQGETLPFDASLRSSVVLDLQGVDVGHWLKVIGPLLPEGQRLEARSGTLKTALTVGFENQTAPALPRLTLTGGLSIHDLDVAWPARGLSLTLKQLNLRGTQVQPLQQEIGSADLTVQALNLQDGGTVPWPAVASAHLTLQGLSPRAGGTPARWQATVRDVGQGAVAVQGDIAPDRSLAHATLDLSAWDLQPWARALQARHPTPLLLNQGALAAKVRASVQWRGEGAALTVDDASLGLSSLQLRNAATQGSARDDRLALERLDLLGVTAKLTLPTGLPGGAPSASLVSAQVATLDIDRLNAQWLRDAQGLWMAPQPPPASQKADTPSAAPVGAVQPLVRLGALNCRQCAVRVQDASVSPAASWRLSQTDLSLQNLSNQLQGWVSVRLNAKVQDSGKLSFQGQVRPEPPTVNGRLEAQGVSLQAAQPYLAPSLNVTLAAAKLQAQGDLQLQVPSTGDAGLSARWRGAMGLSDVRVTDPVNEADFLTWKRLQLTRTDLRYGPGAALQADLGLIELQDFYSRVIINPNGRINLADIRRQAGQAEAPSLTTPQTVPVRPATAQTAALPAVPPSANATPVPDLRWQSIVLRQGRVDFTDNFIQPNYSARLTQIQGDISAVASNQPEPATVNVTGAVDDAAPLRITGRFNPLGPRLFTDIEGSAKGIELTRLTPYAARYAGYPIDKGSLSVTVNYLIDGGQLKANNAIYLDQLTFGDRVEGPDATQLPVRLAVSLLKDRNGVIDIQLPISGSLDDPQFSVGSLIWKVLGNLIAKAITSPFALLGGGSEELGRVAFAPGSDTLDAAARQRLDALAAKLQDRPTLRLEATGRSLPELDAQGLRQAHVERLMRQAKARAQSRALDDTTLDPAERETWLQAAYSAADVRKPRNVLGLAKGVPTAEMQALLEASADAGEARLRELANRRGDRVKAYLTTLLPAERVLLTASRVGREGLTEGQEPGAWVQFTIR